MFNKTKNRLVVIGAGYAGIELLKKVTKSNKFDIVLINDKSIHLHQTDIHKYLNGDIKDSSIAFDLKSFCEKRGIRFICSKVTDVDFKNKNVYFNNTELSYDYLTIATGSVSFFPRQIENILEYSKDIKDIKNLNMYKEKFFNLIKEPRKGKNIAIIGGGLSGVEIALEFAKKLKEFNIKKDDLKISLIEQFPTILPNNDPRLIEKTTQTCDELGIERHHGNFVNKLDNNTIYLSDSSTISFDMVIVNIGVTCQRLFKDETVKINQKNQIVVDEYLRVPEHKEVFVIGDVAQTKDKNGNYSLPTAQIAKQHGKLTAKNLKYTIKNKALIKNEVENKGVLIDLAGKSAVGLIKDYKIAGLNAFILKRFVSYLHRKSFA